MSNSTPVQQSRSADQADDSGGSQVATALGGVALCLFAVQFTLLGLFSGSSFLPLMVGLVLGGAGVYRALGV